MSVTFGRLAAIFLVFFVFGVPAAMAQPVDEQAMWPSPSTADWQKPCLIKWQRTWEDATAVSYETGRPILVCINMDGEIASEHSARIRYRDADSAKLFEPYVCVIASVYRHTPRDYDDAGRRIPCPRFGTVTCGEHIAIEPLLFRKYMEGKRISPRHIMVELDGSETYDVYHTWDKASVFNQIREGISERGEIPVTEIRGDRPILERVASRDVNDREAVEEAYRSGDAKMRSDLLDAAVRHADVASPDLLRQALFGFDNDMIEKARSALAASGSADKIDLIVEALRTPMDESEKEKMLETLARIGETSSSSRAKWLSTLHRGLGGSSGAVDADGWKPGGPGSYPAPEAIGDWSDLMDRVDVSRDPNTSSSADAEEKLALAESALQFARGASGQAGIVSEEGGLLTADPAAARRLTRSYYDEARRSAREAREMGAEGWRVESILTVSTYYLGETEPAYELAESAVKLVPEGSGDWASMAVLTIYAEGRFQKIKAAVAAKERWDPVWLTDVHTSYTVLARHPLGNVGQVVWHYDFLEWLGAKRYAGRVLDEGLTRYPASAELHQRLRTAILDRGVERLEARYDALLAKDDAPPSYVWFAGLASFVAAEYHRRAGDVDAATAAYGRSIAHYERSIELDPENRDSSDFNIALALAGRARLAIEGNRPTEAIDDVLASFDRAPDAAGTLDGLSQTPAMTGKLLVARLESAGDEANAARIRSALEKLDPEHLLEPFVDR